MKYRATIRYGVGVRRYHIADLAADSLESALRSLLDSFPAEAKENADLLELRILVEESSREFGSG